MRIDVYHHFADAALERIEMLLNHVLDQGYDMADNFDALEAVVTALEAKAAENNATLAGLAQAIIDLKGIVVPPSEQPRIDGLFLRAQAVLDSIDVAEGNADDQLPDAAPAP